jgi:hypothetical protein
LLASQGCTPNLKKHPILISFNMENIEKHGIAHLVLAKCMYGCILEYYQMNVLSPK